MKKGERGERRERRAGEEWRLVRRDEMLHNLSF